MHHLLWDVGSALLRNSAPDNQLPCLVLPGAILWNMLHNIALFAKHQRLLDNKVLSCLYSCQSEYFTPLQRVNSYFGSSDNNDLHQGCWKWSHGGLWSLIWIVGSNCVIKHTAKLKKGSVSQYGVLILLVWCVGLLVCGVVCGSGHCAVIRPLVVVVVVLGGEVGLKTYKQDKFNCAQKI